ncbi:MAG: SCP2 sterol-binding domain-containing protein [Acidimicrobiaceae bacterium]|nr:SCP2 sterol-binding domain-containing protein [Acidimicrobiaceae bacterium]
MNRTAELFGNNWLENISQSLNSVEVSEASDGLVQFRVENYPEGGYRLFYVVIESGRITVQLGRSKSPDVLLKLQYSDLVLIWQGQMSLEEAYMTGKMKLEGNQVLLIDGWRPLKASPELRAILQAAREASGMTN